MLEVENLCLSIKNKPILKGLSFEIKSGETIAFVGESGSGKTMTALSLLRLFERDTYPVISGKILFEGVNLLSLSEKEMQSIRGKKISLIFQQALSALNPFMKIGYQILESILMYREKNKVKAKKLVYDLLDYVGILNPIDAYDFYPHMLSGGMKQRVLIAIAIACNPTLLIADEPTTALDVTLQDQILDLLKKIQKETNMSILIITHDLGLVAGFAERICVFKDGLIIENNSTENIFYRAKEPYTQMLLSYTKKWLQHV